ncbi:MAG TPA: TIGR03435 family protein [Bryobacteraceae bacterium]|nr:TIGR03435 family protein [Bryobacteraceae bacterium]
MVRLACLVVASSAFWALCGQDSAPTPGFEAASLRLSDPQSGDRITHIQSDARRIDYHFVRIEELLRRAWPVQFNQIVWVAPMATQSDRMRVHYDLSATMPEGTSREQQRLMLRNLLSDRLQLKAHIEKREAKVYALEISPGGLKIQKARNPPADPDQTTFGMEVAKGQYWKIHSQNVRAPDQPSGLTIYSLIGAIQQMFDRPLVDRTGLEGFYDVDLNVPLNPLPEGGAAPGDNFSFTPAHAAVSAALEKQLGIKVTSATLPYETLVIDHIDPNPVEN